MVSPIVSKLVAEDISRDAEATAARMRLLDEAMATGEAHPAGQTRYGAMWLARRLSPFRRLAQPTGATAHCQPGTV